MSTLPPRSLLRVEGLLVGVLATVAYFALGNSPLLFLALILVPDVSMAGYLLDSEWGARTYNAVHTFVGPVALAVGGLVVNVDVALAAALVWTAHVGFDRLFGFGLKYAGEAFQDTHLQRL